MNTYPSRTRMTMAYNIYEQVLALSPVSNIVVPTNAGGLNEKVVVSDQMYFDPNSNVIIESAGIFSPYADALVPMFAPTPSLALGLRIRANALKVSATTLSGTLTFTQASRAVTGAGTAFTTELAVGDFLNVNNRVFKIASITNDTALVLTDYFYLATGGRADPAVTKLDSIGNSVMDFENISELNVLYPVEQVLTPLTFSSTQATETFLTVQLIGPTYDDFEFNPSLISTDFNGLTCPFHAKLTVQYAKNPVAPGP